MIPVMLLDIHISSSEPFDFGANPGSTLRGAFYEALRTMYDTGAPALSRTVADENPVGWLLRLEDEDTSGGKDVPRPIAFRPPLIPPSRTMSFGVSLYGHGQQQLSLVLSAFHAMQQIGMGRGRQHFILERIDTLDPLTHQSVPFINGKGNLIGEQRNPPSADAYTRLADMLVPDRLTVQFLTPTRIIKEDKLCHEPVFRPWFQRLLERIRLISELYTDNPVWVPFKELLADADHIQIVRNETRWVEMWSSSRRDGMMRPTSGFVGQAHYKGDISRLLPWLILGQALQVGKNTVKGCGWYRIVYEWR